MSDNSSQEQSLKSAAGKREQEVEFYNIVEQGRLICFERLPWSPIPNKVSVETKLG